MMKLSHLIRIIRKHLLLLIIVPVLLASTVFYLTRGRQVKYLSETTIYTGITSGYSLQQQATSDMVVKMTTYDNLINLIKARQSLEEVSVSLLVQTMLLNQSDPQFISKSNYGEIMSRIPQEIKDIVSRMQQKEKVTGNRPVKRSPGSDAGLNDAGDNRGAASASNCVWQNCQRAKLPGIITHPSTL
jgi:capsular polysaccharide biosynthesis protein